MYRLTLYEGTTKTVDEMEDEDDMRAAVDDALNDIEAKRIKSFTVSWISKGKPYKVPFWEK